MTFKQLVKPRTGTKDGPGWCLRFTQTGFKAPVSYPSATAAWWAQWGRHEGTVPPRGIAVPIWFEHYGAYGTPATWGNWGHVAIRLADGRVLTSPFFASQLDSNGLGQAIYPSIQAMCDAMPGGAKYLGWSEYMNGLRIVEPRKVAAAKPKPFKPVLGQEEDDEMKPTVHVRLDKGKRGEYTLAHPEIGRDLKAGEKRAEGKVTVFRGFMVTTDMPTGYAWARMYARGIGNETSGTERADYIAIQAAATRVSLEVA